MSTVPNHSKKTNYSSSPASYKLRHTYPLFNNSNKKQLTIEKVDTQPRTYPSLSQNWKDSIVSGVGSGIGSSIGFNLSDRLMSSIFGNRTILIEHKNEVINDKPLETQPLLKSFQDMDCKQLEEYIKQSINKGEKVSIDLFQAFQECKQY